MHNIIEKEKANGCVLNPMQLQSATIDLLRFPLAIMVIFIHMNPNVVNLVDADFDIVSGRGLYNVIGIVLSHVLTHIAVPTFFFISGYLFFANFQSWSWEGYTNKMHSRVKTLLVPYILWNIVPFLLVILVSLGGVVFRDRPIDGVMNLITEKSWHVLYDYNEWGASHVDWLGNNLRMTGPYTLPLWFLRDLIVVTVLTPIIYFTIRKLKLYAIGILFLAYISRIWTLLPGFHITAFFFFTTGAYFALNGMNIVQFVKKYKLLFLPLCFILLAVSMVYDGKNTDIGANVYPFFILVGVFSAFYVASVCIERYNIKPNRLLVSSCFFIYAFHGAPIPLIGSPLGFVRGMLHRLIPGITGIEEGICYLIAPFFTALLCIVVLKIARKMLPKTTLLFSGNK